MPVSPSAQLFSNTPLAYNPILSAIMILSQRQQDIKDRAQADEQLKLENEQEKQEFELRKQQLDNQNKQLQANLEANEIARRQSTFQEQYGTNSVPAALIAGTIPTTQSDIFDPVLSAIDPSYSSKQFDPLSIQLPTTGETATYSPQQLESIFAGHEQAVKEKLLPGLQNAQFRAVNDYRSAIMRDQLAKDNFERELRKQKILHGYKMEEIGKQIEGRRQMKDDLGLPSVLSTGRINSQEGFQNLVNDPEGAFYYDIGTGTYTGVIPEKTKRELSQLGVVPVDSKKVDGIKQELSAASTALTNLQRAKLLIENKYGSLNAAAARFRNGEELLKSVLTDSEYQQLVANSQAFATSVSPLITGENPSRLSNEDRRVAQLVASIQPNQSSAFLARQIEFLGQLPGYAANSRFSRLPEWQRKELFDTNELPYEVQSTKVDPLERARNLFSAENSPDTQTTRPTFSGSLAEKLRKIREGQQ